LSWKASGTAKEITHGKHGEKLSMADKLVLMVLSENYLDDKGYVWCSQKLLSKHCVCSERGLRGILERLERFGLVGIAHRAKLGNYYALIFMRNPVPQKQDFSEEPRAVSEEPGAFCEECGALSEEQAVPPEQLTVETVDGAPPAPTDTCPICGFLTHLCMGHKEPKKKNSPRPFGGSRRDPPVQFKTPLERKREDDQRRRENNEAAAKRFMERMSKKNA
jgi:hypothetical protein